MVHRTAVRVVAAAFAFGLVGLPVHATTYTVTSTADTIATDGLVTLREAITAAVSNAPAGDAPAGTPGLDTINFAIPGPGVQTIALSSDLPLILDPIFLDGLSQPGAAPGAPLIEIHGGAQPLRFIGSAASGSTIRGLAINGFASTAISVIASSSNVITSNFIGTDAAGTTALGGAVGIFVSDSGAPSTGNTIGGSTAALGNLIVVNSTAILVAQSGPGISNTVIAGNRIGTNASGSALIMAATTGVAVVGSTNTTIGGSTGTTPGAGCSGACNLIDAQIGVSAAGNGGDALTIEGNFIGTNLAGTAALVGSGGFAGIQFSSPTPWAGSVTIGGAAANARNVISGFSQGSGILVSGQNPPSSIAIEGNFIGTDTTGATSLPNRVGVSVDTSSGLGIGGSAGAGNLISGNSFGIQLSDSSANVVQSNIIGPSGDGSTPLAGPQTLTGVAINQPSGPATNKSANNIVGASTSGGPGGNVIAHLTVGVSVGGGTNNRILSNSMFGTFVPIGLGILPVPANDPCDTDTGPNNGQNYPVLTSAVFSGGGVMLGGNLNSAPNTSFTIEVFSNPSTSFGQATTLIASATVTTNAACDAPLSIALPLLPAGTIVTAMATDASGNTSPVSNGVGVGASADIALLKAVSAPVPFGGQNITYTIQAINNGPGVANNIVVTDVLPVGMTLVSTSPAGFCTGTTTITCTAPSAPPGAAPTFTIVVKAPLAGGTFSNTATVTTATPDPLPANNSATATVTLAASTLVPALSPAILLLLGAVLGAIAIRKMT